MFASDLQIKTENPVNIALAGFCFCTEEELDKQQFSALMETYVYSSQEPIREDIFACLGDRPSVLQAREIGERILSRMREYVAVFVEGMVA